MEEIVLLFQIDVFGYVCWRFCDLKLQHKRQIYSCKLILNLCFANTHYTLSFILISEK